jgi:hypothetical protein
MPTEKELRAKLEAIIDEVYGQTNDMRRAAALLGNIPHTRLMEDRKGGFQVRTLRRMAKAEHREFARTASALLKLVLERQTRLDLPENWMDNIDNFIRLDPRRVKRGDPVLPLLRHAGLQLQFTDFAEDALLDAAILEEPSEALHRAAVADLLFTFINGRFFSSYATAVRRNKAVPVHPFGWLELGSFVTQERAGRDVPGRVAEGMEEGVDRLMFSMGRETKLVFSDNRELAHLTGNEQVLKKPAETFVDEIVDVATRDDALIYPLLAGLLEFEARPVNVPDRDVVTACAATAAFRCELAAINASRSFLQGLADETTPSRRPALVRIASRIFEQCHATYLIAAERMSEAIRSLPEQHPEQHLSDRERIASGYHLTGAALSTTGGIWFFAHHGPGPRINTPMSIAFLCKQGSVMFPATLDERGTGSMFHRFAFDEGDHLPKTVPENFEKVHMI